MNKEQKTTAELIEAFKNGEFDKPDTHTQCEAGWYDWFCKDSSLANKTKNLYKKAIRIINIDNNKKIDINKTYVWFKNNCPCNGHLYDDFRFAHIETGDVLYTIVPKSGHNVDCGISEVWGKENDFSEPLVRGTWNDVLVFFGQ